MALWKERCFENIVSAALVDELAEVLARPAIRRRVEPQRSLALLRRLRDDALWVEGVAQASGLRDPADDFLLSAALDSGAEFIVTWERVLLEQQTCQGVRIINPDQFASLLARAS